MSRIKQALPEDIDVTKEGLMRQEELDKVFVKTWLEAIEQGKNAHYVAEHLRLNYTFVINKAQSLRRRGVKLPTMRSGRYAITPEHVDELNQIIGDNDGK